MARAKIVWGSRGKKSYFADDKPVSKAEFDRLFPTKIEDLIRTQTPINTLMNTSAAWPRNSDALGCHPNQKEAAQAESIRLGVPTEYTSDGKAVLRDGAHQRDFMKALKMHNRDGGYGGISG